MKINISSNYQKIDDIFNFYRRFSSIRRRVHVEVVVVEMVADSRRTLK